MFLGPSLLALIFLPTPSEDLFLFAKDEAELSREIRADELRAHVYRLASPEFLGRRGPGAARTSRHLEATFRRLKLEPAFGDSYMQPIPSLVTKENGQPPGFLGRNVGAVLLGSDAALKDEWIILSAHFDHLGKEEDKFFPGADDNASGVAMLLEVAEQFALRRQKPKRSVMFVAFDLEEVGLLGSTHFAAHPPRDIHKLKAFITADMLGRSMANVMEEYVFVLGSETASQLRRLLSDVKTRDGLRFGTLGADIIGTRGDYGPFRDRQVPFLFFSTGQHPDYHRPTDLPERVDYAKLQKISQWIADLTWRLANDTEAPRWNEQPAQDLDEVRTILKLVERIEQKPRQVVLSSSQRSMLESFRKRLVGIMERGKITDSERTWLVWSARILLITVF